MIRALTLFIAAAACTAPAPESLASLSPTPSPTPIPSVALPSATSVGTPVPITGVTVTPTGPLRGDLAWVVRRTAAAPPASERSERYELVTVPLVGGEPRVAVTWEFTGSRIGPPPPSPAARQQLSPDGRRFALATESRRIVVVDLESGAARQITNDPEYLDSEPVWSRDGTKLAFRRSRGGLDGGIWSVNADGTGTRRIVIGDAQRVSGGEPVYDWTPDGEVVCYSEPLDQYRCVRTADATLFTVVQNVTGLAPADWRNASPRLVSAVTQRGAGTAILVAEEPRSGQPPRTIATGPAADVEYLSPRWHPTANEVAYVEARMMSLPAGRAGPILGLFASTLDGTRRPLGTQGSPREPEWAPAGDEVVFLGRESNASAVDVGLFATRSDGSLFRRLWLATDLVSLATRRY